MISLVPLGLGVDPAMTEPTKSPVMQKISVQAISGWNALLLGIVTGFAMSAGTLLFNKIAKRLRWM